MEKLIKKSTVALNTVPCGAGNNGVLSQPAQSGTGIQERRG